MGMYLLLSIFTFYSIKLKRQNLLRLLNKVSQICTIIFLFTIII